METQLIFLFFSSLIAYLLGSISAGLLVVKAFSLADPRTYGSGNIGATNVLRSGNRWAALITLLGDVLKGWLAVMLVAEAISRWQWPSWWQAIVAVMVVVGHIWPIFYRFKGGKAVATALGVLLAVQPWLALIAASTWLLVFWLKRISSLAALSALGITMLATQWLITDQTHAISIIIISGLVLLRHKENVMRLIHGTEQSFKASAKNSK